jgi:putative nucleotidyltransferase-like protein
MAPSDAVGADDLWRRLDALIDRARSADDIRSHQLEVPAARRLRAVGRPVPEDFVVQERLAGARLLALPLLLERVRAAYDGRIVVLKGPEVGVRYPDPALRGFGDLDVLVDDAAVAHRALLADGFVEVGDPELYIDIHHLRPLVADGLPLPVEVHSRPKWLEPLSAPSTAELIEAAVPGSIGVAGVLALPPEHHALVLAVHSWAHEPLRRLRDLVDIAAVAAAADPREIDRLADAWGVRPLWNATAAASDALFHGGRRPWALRIWAQNLDHVRERTVLENHLQRWLSDFWALPARAALRRVPVTLGDELGPGGGEGWRAKLARTALAVRNASRGRSQHDRQLEDRTRQNGR